MYDLSYIIKSINLLNKLEDWYYHYLLQLMIFVLCLRMISANFQFPAPSLSLYNY